MQERDGQSKSKSQIKRELLALQALAQRLVALPDGEARRLPLPEEVFEAVAEGRSMQRSALKRQVRFIGGLLARHDCGPIERALAELHRPHVEDVRAFHEVEKWRDALVAGEDAAVDAVTRACPGADRRQLLELVRNARDERGRGGPPRAARRLFRYLMSMRENG